MKKIAVTDLKPGMQLSRSVADASGGILLESCLLLNEESISLLSGCGIKEVHVIETDNLDEEIRAMGEFIDKGFNSTREKTMDIARQFLERIAVGQIGEEVDKEDRILPIIETALQDANILVKLSGVKAVDNYLYAHSVNTAVLALLIASKMDFGDDDLLELAKSAMMSDVGMMLVPASIWEHNGPLSQEQRKKVQEHVSYSREVMASLPKIARNIVDAVYQHHERCDGRGYPESLTGEQILMSAKVIAVADVFAAIREPRVYRLESGPVRALKDITSNHGFSHEVLRMFLATVSVYPVQSVVMLNNGSVGVVTAVTENNPFRPVVEILKDENGKDVESRPRIDLADSENRGLFIEEALDELPE